MNLNSIASLINLLNIKRVGPQKVRSLVSAHKNPAEVFSLSTHEICAVNGVDLKLRGQLERQSTMILD